MSVFFTSDTHFGHQSIVEIGGRPYKDCDEMDSALVHNWNAKVTEDDTVYHLGDLAFYNTQEQFEELIGALNGKIILIKGNHDTRRRLGWITEIGLEVYDYLELKHKFDETKRRQLICMFHFPIISWHHRNVGAWHLHGHCHGSLDEATDHRVDIGTDEHNFAPISYQELRAIMSKREFTPIDHHTKGGE